MAFDLGDYQDVKARHAELKAAFPEGSLRPADLEHPYRIETIGAQTFIVYVAACYRTPDDTNPGIGAAWEPFPGKTSYTRDSELQNAETSAWGRAIAAALVVDLKGGVATQDEIRNRRRDQDMAPPPPVLPPDVDPEAIEEVKATLEALSDDQRVRFTSWKEGQGFPWPWPTAACTAMLAELARIISADAVDLAAEPCALCGSRRARRVLDAHGRVRCSNANACRARVAELEAPFVEAGSVAPPASTGGGSVPDGGSSPDSLPSSTGGEPTSLLTDGEDDTPPSQAGVVSASPPAVSEVF